MFSNITRKVTVDVQLEILPKLLCFLSTTKEPASILTAWWVVKNVMTRLSGLLKVLITEGIEDLMKVLASLLKVLITESTVYLLKVLKRTSSKWINFSVKSTH